MRYKRAVEKLRLLAEGCEEIGFWPPWDEPYLLEMYAFGAVLEGADPLDEVQVAGVIRLPAEEVTWGSSPHGTEWLADRLRLSKGGFEYWWRSYLDPVWNHYIRSPVRIWSQDGIEDETLAALAERRFGELRRVVPDPVDERLQLRDDLDAALLHLRQVHGSYWDADWRREHRGMGRNPEHELWEAVEGYLDLISASRPAPQRADTPAEHSGGS
ncbi:hypothetical protein EAS64_03075 [Trebonia kvetii]|uniref:DUF7711 domain-containing protein n=1 Tax=Trebonia kvetii TaxID=2480626 RepID=A0A6P2C4S2_9ACTN|nr:hypothetical protein [Trebonia kvetii]TVZ06419.1 hypothetical protein EAS64_03075 [Trebonia kvetii]